MGCRLWGRTESDTDRSDLAVAAVSILSFLLGGVAPNQHFSSGGAVQQCLQVQLFENFIS